MQGDATTAAFVHCDGAEPQAAASKLRESANKG